LDLVNCKMSSLNKLKLSGLLFVVSVSLSLFAWSGTTWHVALALFSPVVWYFSPTRLTSFIIMAGYHAAASWALPYGITIYFGSPFVKGAALWLIAAGLIGSVWGLCWHKSSKIRLLLLPLGILFTAVPPVGLVGWCSPITGSGILLPGFGLYGVFLAVMGMIALTQLPFVGRFIALIAVGFWAYMIDRPVEAPEHWKAIETHSVAYQEDILTGNSRKRHRELSEIMIEQLPARVVVSPESSGGRWHGLAEQFWGEVTGRYPDTAFIIGAEYPSEKRGTTDNVLLCVQNGTFKVLYRQRMPVPLTMWNPLKKDSVNAYFFQGAVEELAGQKVGFLICYEQLLPWVVVYSLVSGAEVLVGSANDWWAVDGNIPEIQYVTMHAWARLFGVRALASFNL